MNGELQKVFESSRSGGYKGFGMGLFVEIMSACLTGSNLGIEASSFAMIKEILLERGNFLLL